MAKGTIIERNVVDRRKGHMYYIDKPGNVVEVKMNTKGGKTGRMMNPATNIVDKAYKTAPIITMIAVVLLGIAFFIIQYRKNALESRLAAMQILRLQQDTGIMANSTIVQEALHDDFINNIAHKAGI
jgi:protease II